MVHLFGSFRRRRQSPLRLVLFGGAIAKLPFPGTNNVEGCVHRGPVQVRSWIFASPLNWPAARYLEVCQVRVGDRHP